MFSNFFKNALATIDKMTLPCESCDCDKTDKTTFIVNGQELDLTDEENVKKAYDLIDSFASNPLMTWLIPEDSIKDMVDDAKKQIENIHKELVEKAAKVVEVKSKPKISLEDDASYIANAYLEDTYKGCGEWDSVPNEQKTKCINALADFFNWMKEQCVKN